MRFMGSKARIGKELAEVIRANTEYDTVMEPFMGGGNMTVYLAERFESVIASEYNEGLAMMWQAALTGWEPPAVTEKQYRQLRTAEPSPLKGFAEFGCSFGGKSWGGFARGGFNSDGTPRNHQAESARAVVRDAKKMGNVQVYWGNALDIRADDPVAWYLDPPYKGTTGYGEAFDYEAFLEWTDLLKGDIFLSEYEAPDDSWTELYSKPLRKSVNLASDRPIATERLFLKRRTKCSSK